MLSKLFTLFFLQFTPIFGSFAGLFPNIPQEQFVAENGKASIKLDIFQAEIYGQISVGTPSQTFNVLFNQVSNDFWVANDNFTRDPTLIPPDHEFNRKKSQTFMPNGSHYYETFFEATGVIGKDIIRIGNLTTISQFGMVDKYNSYFVGTKVADGMFGLNIDDRNKNLDIPRSLDLIADKLSKPIFTIWTNGLVAASGPVPGQLTFGSEDAEHCQSDFVYFPLDDPWRLYATLHSIELVLDGAIMTKWEIPEQKREVWIPIIGKEYEYAARKEGICGPQEIVRQIGKYFDVRWNPKSDWDIGKMDCQSENARPDIVLSIGNKKGQTGKWVMKPKDFLIELPKGECAFIFYSWGDSSVWDLETLFMNRWCTAYNFREKLIGFGHKKK